MIAKSSIHIIPIKANSQVHNLRETKLDYVREDLTKDNTSFVLDQISNRLETIKSTYKAHVGQKMQKKATPIREAVVNLKDASPQTMNDLKKLASKLRTNFEIDCFQIHIHADEGHKDKHGEWKPNYHAHMVFDWTDKKTGKSIKLNREDMTVMQDLVSETLCMVRGKASGKQHLNSIQYKAEKEFEKFLELQQDLEMQRATRAQISQNIELLERRIDKLNLNDEDYQVYAKTLLGGSKVDKEATIEKLKGYVNKARIEKANIQGRYQEKLRLADESVKTLKQKLDSKDKMYQNALVELRKAKNILNDPDELAKHVDRLMGSQNKGLNHD